MDYSKVGDLIASLRKERGLTQKELADKLDITDRAVSKWERGLGCPDVSLLDDLSNILGVSISEILKGRRLEKEEIASNDSVIESMIYSRESFKHKLKRYFNYSAIGIMIAVGLFVLLSILNSWYYLHKTYYYYEPDQTDNYLFREVHQNISAIKNNQGIYSDTDYNKILLFIDDMNSLLDQERDLNYYVKTTYTFPELVNFYNTFCVDNLIDLKINVNNGTYAILHQYDSTVLENMIYYDRTANSLLQNVIPLYVALKNPYYYDKKINDEIIATIRGIIYLEYSKDNMLLNDIIKVGEINE